ncbi:MAG: hypothetical protein ACLQVD_07055 [Capsulimonadaceae bacterium]
MPSAKPHKVCFFLTSIDVEGPTPSHRSESLVRRVLGPAISHFGYEVVAGHALDCADTITAQVLEYLVEADIVVADFVGDNSNLGYATAIRDIVNKPTIFLHPAGTPLPFDIAAPRAIPVDHESPDSIAASIIAIQAQVRRIEDHRTCYDGALYPLIKQVMARPQKSTTFLRASRSWNSLRHVAEAVRGQSPVSTVAPVISTPLPVRPLPPLRTPAIPAIPVRVPSAAAIGGGAGAPAILSTVGRLWALVGFSERGKP